MDELKKPKKRLEVLPKIEGLEYGKCIGEGFFSRVFSGHYNGQKVAIKVIERGSDESIRHEISILEVLKGANHIVQLLNVFETEATILVFEYVPSISKNHFYARLSASRIRRVLKKLLEATAAAHERNVIHRDIKYGNIMVLPHYAGVKLIDWGCAENVSDDMETKAGSRWCRSPEMLLGYRSYGKAGDMWAIGVFIFEILTKGKIPWKANTTPLLLQKLTPYFGGKSFMELAEKLKLELSESIINSIQTEKTKSLSSAFSHSMNELADDRLISLMNSLLQVDPSKRPTAQEALAHSYFLV